MRAIAIALDGVLRKPLDVEAQDFGASLLYAALCEHFRVVVLGTDDPVRDDHFLRINGMNRHVKVERMLPGNTRGISGQVERLRNEGYHFEFVVIPDPETARDLYAEGVPVLMYLHPTFSAKSFRPDFDGGLQPWSELASEVEFQLMSKATQRSEPA